MHACEEKERKEGGRFFLFPRLFLKGCLWHATTGWNKIGGLFSQLNFYWVNNAHFHLFCREKNARLLRIYILSHPVSSPFLLWKWLGLCCVPICIPFPWKGGILCRCITKKNNKKTQEEWAQPAAQKKRERGIPTGRQRNNFKKKDSAT